LSLVESYANSDHFRRRMFLKMILEIAFHQHEL